MISITRFVGTSAKEVDALVVPLLVETFAVLSMCFGLLPVGSLRTISLASPEETELESGF